jgi:hypothetical protein
MRVYIPFNSNDFNSVFTTLSISPCSFYPNRKYSFKRATTTFLNESEDFLIGYEKPIFHNIENDKDYGFPVLIEIEIEKPESEWHSTDNGVKYAIIENTVYLLNNFKLLFRNEKELNETFAKSLKSIETKYATLAKENSKSVEFDCLVSELPSLQLPFVNNSFNSLTFQKERKLNRLLGVILGSAIAYTNLTSKEWQEISILFRYLNNNLSLLLNKVGENNEYEKNQALEIIDKIQRIYETIEELETSIMLGSNSSFTSDLLITLKQSKIFNISTFNLLIEGLMVTSKEELPLSLRLIKLKRAINAKFNAKYPTNYIERVNNSFSDVKYKIEDEINLSRKNNKLTFDSLVRPKFINDKLELIIPEGLLENEKNYLLQCLKFFIEIDNVPDLETFFINRKKILTDLAIHFKGTIDNFDGSEEREYVILLLNSFENLRGGFDVSKISNEVLKSIAVLFTSGRDLLRFIENNEREEIQNSLIYYTIWGSIYGATILPKTLTESITEDKSNIKTLIDAYSESICEFQKSNTSEILIKENLNDKSENKIKEQLPEKSKEVKTEVIIGNETIRNYLPSISVLGSQILEQVESKRKVKLSELIMLSKTFKNHSDLKDFIEYELPNKIKVTKENGINFAEKMEGNE